MEWVASNLHSTSEHGLSSITTADAHTSAASSRLNRRPRRFKWTRPFRRKTKSGFCACAITFQLASTYMSAPTCQLKANSHIACCAHAVLYRPPVMPYHVNSHMPCCAVALRSRFQNGMVGARQRRGTVCVNQTWPHCINHMGETQSKPLATHHGKGNGMGTACYV